jgi:hypothetical protein
MTILPPALSVESDWNVHVWFHVSHLGGDDPDANSFGLFRKDIKRW